jgi:hypothetical protein
LADAGTKVGFVNLKPALDLGDLDYSFCPVAVLEKQPGLG